MQCATYILSVNTQVVKKKNMQIQLGKCRECKLCYARHKQTTNKLCIVSRNGWCCSCNPKVDDFLLLVHIPLILYNSPLHVMCEYVWTTILDRAKQKRSSEKKVVSDSIIRLNIDTKTVNQAMTFVHTGFFLFLLLHW